MAGVDVIYLSPVRTSTLIIISLSSGAAKMLAKALLAAAEPTGLTGLYIVVYLATTLFTASVTNNAAVTIMFPVAYEASLDAKVRCGRRARLVSRQTCTILTPPCVHTLATLGGLYAVSLPADDGRQCQFYDAYRVPDEPYGVRSRRMYVLLLKGAVLDCVASSPFPTLYRMLTHQPPCYIFSTDTFLDYVRFGGGLQVVLGILTVAIVATVQFWWIWFLACLAALIVFLVFTPRSAEASEANAQELAAGEAQAGSPPRPEIMFYQPDMGLSPMEQFDDEVEGEDGHLITLENTFGRRTALTPASGNSSRDIGLHTTV